ncbi:hypothetical protein OB905_04325 [Halobacteria archaeon AArc-dxtr1]|nr:hypothetical protein [Halobacteria archaeon AArc-dxtr1]
MVEGGDSIDTRIQTSPSWAVVEAVADAEGISADELEPPEYEALHDVIDPDALNALFSPRGQTADRDGGTVIFNYCNYEVIVESDGSVRLE